MSKIKRYITFSCLALAVLFLADILYKKVVHMDVMSYADSYNVSFNVAKYRLHIQGEIGELDGFLTNNYNSSFSGLYIQHQPTYSVNVLFVNPNEVNRLEYLWTDKSWSNYVRTSHVEYTLDELKLAQDKLYELISQSGASNSFFLDIINNRVDLHVLKERHFEKNCLSKA